MRWNRAEAAETAASGTTFRRRWTICARRVSTGFAIQHFSFSTVEGLDLGAVPAVFTHDNAHLLGGQRLHPVAVGGLELRGLAAHHAMDFVEEQHPMTSPSLVTWRVADARRT